jgi:hypothetical protein
MQVKQMTELRRSFDYAGRETDFLMKPTTTKFACICLCIVLLAAAAQLFAHGEAEGLRYSPAAGQRGPDMAMNDFLPIELRGLGATQALILLDGTLARPHQRLGIAIQPDINGIPLSAIERIEVLPVTVSAIYGGSATGGVINIRRTQVESGMSPV